MLFFFICLFVDLFYLPILSPNRPLCLGTLKSEPDAVYVLESFVEGGFAEAVAEAVECGCGEGGARFGVLYTRMRSVKLMVGRW